MGEKVNIILKGGSIIEVDLDKQFVNFDKNVLKVWNKLGDSFEKDLCYISLPFGMVVAIEL